MKRFIVERNLPGAGNLTKEELQNIAQTSCKVVLEMGKGYQWVESLVTDDKIICVHIAESEEAIREHAKRGNFPCNAVREVKAVFGPMTAYQS